MMFHVYLKQGERGWGVVERPALPGCISQGRDEEEALANIKEAIEGWLEVEDDKAVRKFKPKRGQKQMTVAV